MKYNDLIENDQGGDYLGRPLWEVAFQLRPGKKEEPAIDRSGTEHSVLMEHQVQG